MRRKVYWVILACGISLWSGGRVHAADYVQIEQRQFLQVVRGVDNLKQENRLLLKYKAESEKLRGHHVELIKEMQSALDLLEKRTKDDGALLQRQANLIDELEASRELWRMTGLTMTAAFVLLAVWALY